MSSAQEPMLVPSGKREPVAESPATVSIAVESSDPSTEQKVAEVAAAVFEDGELEPDTEIQPQKPKLRAFKRFKQLAKLKSHKESQVARHLSESSPVEASGPKILHSPPGPLEDDYDDDDPRFLAQKIRELISTLPAVSHIELHAPEPVPAPFPPKCDASGCLIPPSSAVHVHDQHLISLLSNSTVMNGKKKEWPTVWSVLLSLAPPALDMDNQKGKDSVDELSSHAEINIAPPVEPDTIMLYVPLEPTDDDEVKVAETTLVLVGSAPNAASMMLATGWKCWPFHGKKGQTAGPPASPSTPSLTSATPAKVKKVWLPSTSKISFEAAWWGYRIYFPPPVMTVLSNQEVEAVKRAAMISAALTWFFAHLPVTAFPVPLQPIFLLLQKIMPYLGYIGTFISWSWSTIKSYDSGYGIILNAIWLLPVALLPSTWTVNTAPGATPTKEVNSRTSTSAPITSITDATMPTAPISTPPGPPVHTALIKMDDDDGQDEILSQPVVDSSEVTSPEKNDDVPDPPQSPTSGTRFVEALDENETVIANLAAVLEPAAYPEPETLAEEATETTEPPSVTEIEQLSPAGNSITIFNDDGDVREEPVERPTSPIAAVWKYFKG